jgi:UDP-2,4-diacetamido-2,4,6-trideoxy-beta-L-altropyranose hydrolase
LKVVIRADASVNIGTGHVMRCLTLADKMDALGADIHFICRDFDGHMKSAIQVKGYACTLLPPPKTGVERQADDPPHAEWLGVNWQEDANDTIRAIQGSEVDWLIVDHYGIDEKWHQALRSGCDRIMVIDDLADRKMDCDLLLDQTYGRNPQDYSDLIKTNTKLLLGSNYSLLRPGYFKRRQEALVERSERKEVTHILVFVGGMDSGNISALVLRALDKITWETPPMVDVVLNRNAPYLEEIKLLSSTFDMPVGVHVDVEDMAGLMLQADLAIGGGGGASWERCCLGLPAVAIEMAKNQKQVLRSLSDLGALVDVGEQERVTVEVLCEEISGLIGNRVLMENISSAAFGVCDGLGAGRVVSELAPLYARDGEKVTIREVTENDVRLLFEWQNLPETRKYAKNPDKPLFSEHEKWLKEKISNPSSYIWIIEHGGEPSGVIRLDLQDGENKDNGLLISIHIVPAKFRLGVGLCAVRTIQRIFSGNLLTAEILPQNAASLALFEKAGFTHKQDNIFAWNSD